MKEPIANSSNPTSSSPAASASAPAADAPPHVITKRAITGWALYDLANTIFSMGVVSLYFPLWIRDAVGTSRADSYYNLITAISMGMIFVASPLLGSMTDRARRRMPFLFVSTIICVLFTAFFARTSFWVTVILFVFANIAYQAGLQFYDAMLPEVSTEKNRGKIGGLGVGIGYLGSYFAVAMGLILSKVYGIDDKPLFFVFIAILFLLFALPCFVFVRERGNPRPRPINLAMVLNSTRETIHTLRSSQQYPGLLRFLVGRVFYTDAINTVISNMVLFTQNVAENSGMNQDQAKEQAHWIMLFAITFAITGGFAWGWLTDRWGPKRTLSVVLKAWMGIFLFAAIIGLFHLPLWTMYLMSAGAGFSLGGVWAADRPYMLRLTPPARIGEFYGLYGMVGRFSAVTGPVIWWLVFDLCTRQFKMTELASEGVAVLSLMILVLTGYTILRTVSDQPRNGSALEVQGTTKT
jgi:UMF1 family MFS transporter